MIPFGSDRCLGPYAQDGYQLAPDVVSESYQGTRAENGNQAGEECQGGYLSAVIVCAAEY